MTKEEAGQIVLEGNPWVKCITCAGTCKEPGPIDVIKAASGTDHCKRCDGKGYSVPALIAEAYAMLGIELPKKPMTKLEMTVDLIADHFKEILTRKMLGRSSLDSLKALFPATFVDEKKK